MKMQRNNASNSSQLLSAYDENKFVPQAWVFFMPNNCLRRRGVVHAMLRSFLALRRTVFDKL
jgi:hypothetical protein